MSAFENRKLIAKQMLVSFLSTFTIPRGLDADGQAERISHIADAFARKMPTGPDFEAAIEKVFQKLRDTHLSNSWPAQAAFVMAMPQGAGSKAALEAYRVRDEVESLTAKMQAGDGVPETAIWGVNASRLPSDLLERYRIGSVQSWIGLHKGAAHAAMRSRYGHVVDSYFPEERGGAA